MADENKSIAATSAPEQQLPADDQPLFRAQVLAEQQSQWLGKVLITSPISHAVFAGSAIVAASSIVALLFFGDYTRKERITGWLVPEHGLVQVYTPQSGVISQMSVQEGSNVQTGDRLLIVSTELQSEALGATRFEIVRRLQRRRDSLKSEQKLITQLYKQQLKSLNSRITASLDELGHRERELEVQHQRVELASKSVNRLSKHRSGGVVSEDRWLVSENERLDQLMRLRELQRDSSATQRERLALEAELEALPLEHQKNLAQNARDVDTLEQELAEAESRRQIVLTAPHSGTVAALQLEQGSSVKADLPLLSIIPAGSELEAQLYLPSRAIGFIEVGQSVLLRYRAFPYQKFGHYQGTIAKVSRSTVNRAELSPQMRGATDPLALDEPVYPVTVRLGSQTVNAYGRAIDLQPGMILEADVLIENRRLIEWVLEPLFTLTGKMRA